MSLVRKHFAAIFTLVLCSIVGFSWIAEYKSTQTALVKVSVDDRFPAAFRSGVDLSTATKKPLEVALKGQFLAAASISKAMGTAEVNFNQFMEVDSQGKNSLACLVYDKVILSFEADGMAVSGQKPVFEVEAPCGFQQSDLAKMNAIKIPVGELVKQEAQSGEFAFESSPGHVYRLKFALGEWPKSWFLKSVSFKSDAGKQEVFWTQDFVDAKGASNAGHFFMTW